MDHCYREPTVLLILSLPLSLPPPSPQCGCLWVLYPGDSRHCEVMTLSCWLSLPSSGNYNSSLSLSQGITHNSSLSNSLMASHLQQQYRFRIAGLLLTAGLGGQIQPGGTLTSLLWFYLVQCNQPALVHKYRGGDRYSSPPVITMPLLPSILSLLERCPLLTGSIAYIYSTCC